MTSGSWEGFNMLCSFWAHAFSGRHGWDLACLPDGGWFWLGCVFRGSLCRHTMQYHSLRLLRASKAAILSGGSTWHSRKTFELLPVFYLRKPLSTWLIRGCLLTMRRGP